MTEKQPDGAKRPNICELVVRLDDITKLEVTMLPLPELEPFTPAWARDDWRGFARAED